VTTLTKDATTAIKPKAADVPAVAGVETHPHVDDVS
jgi:hypothetical protein